MEVEKRGAKGGFFQLFDWNTKSKKKLFSSKYEPPESSNQGKEYFHASTVAQLQQRLENGFTPNPRGHHDYSYASSASGDSENGTKAPGVVARLMGLDSLPTSNTNKPSFSPFIDPHSFRDSTYSRAEQSFQSEHDTVIFESVRNKLDGLNRDPLDLRLQKLHNRPIERFQREVLPPKSAKPISVTHHRLLSPIKSPGFIPPKNAAYIIEAAAKIIEQSPRATAKGKFASSSSSSPIRFRDLKEKMEIAQKSSRDLKEKMEAAQKGKNGKPIKHLKRQLSSGGDKGFDESKRVDSQRVKTEENSVSLSVQAKANLHKGDKSSSVSNRSSEKQKEVRRNLPNSQKKVEKQNSSRKQHPEVLRPNHQKQNLNAEPSYSNSKGRKEINSSPNYVINGQQLKKTVNKIVVSNSVTSKTTNSTDSGDQLSSSRTRSSAKRLPFNGNVQSDGTVSEKSLVMKDEKPVKRNIAFDGDSNWDSINRNSLDVVSFTFNSPIKKSGSGSNNKTTLEATESDIKTCDSSASSGFNVIGGDALSVLLEQKLKELCSRVELSEGGSGSSSFNSYGNMGPTANSENHVPVNCDIRRCKGEKDKMGLVSGSVLSHPSFSGSSFESYDVDRSCSSQGMSLSSTRKFHHHEFDVEISDTASSISKSETVNSTLCFTNSKDNPYWELHYIYDILNNSELMFEEFALGRAHKIIDPTLFDQLENQIGESNKVTEEKHSILERKVLFDCVNECLELKCGNSKFMVKHKTFLGKKELLAEELFKEITCFKNVEELMVDELVDKDMSSKNGKWLDFEIERFEEGVEIEKSIVNSLVDELMKDFLLL